MNTVANKTPRAMLIMVMISLAATTWPAAAGTTDLANIPLANSTTTAIRPNIAFVMDDSGSMNDENMPDSDGTNKGSYCWKWHKYNTLAYNPAHTYKAPIKADGSRYPDATFTAALKDGYFAVTAKMYNGSTTNGTTDLTTLGTVTTTKAVTNAFPSFSKKHYASSVKVTLLNGSQLELLGSVAVPNTAGTTNRDTLGEAIRDSINAQSDISGSGFSASYSTSSHKLTITAPESQAGLTTTPTITLVKSQSGGSLQNVTPNAFSGTTVAGFFYSTHNTDPNSKTCDANSNYNVVTSPSNIAAPGTTNGSAAALKNYANWYSYYRKRAFLAKAGIGEAFAALEEDKFRVGYFSIGSIESGANNGTGTANNDLAIDTFTGTASGTHRANWFDRLYGTRESGWTPLRGALSRMGRMYAGKITGWDPVQYSCQRNYTILSTDGYWNADWETSSYGPKDIDNSEDVGDRDGVAGVTRPELDSSKAQNTLADVAYYYYHTDLRPGSQTEGACVASDPNDKCRDNVPPASSNPSSPVDDVAQHQHMTTFTVGLGVSGSLTYQDGYKTSISGDYYDIVQGTKNWPSPVDGTNDTKDKIDDLWHAAVNGRGTYFSANDPNSLSSGISTALKNITSSTGSGAAAATSNLQPTSGDNFIYIATYRTLHWDGELSAYTVDLGNGNISSTSTWLAAALLKNKIAASGDSDTRTIYVSESGILKQFTWNNLSASEQAYFDNTQLNQYAEWDSTQKSTATGNLMVNYLRGQERYEDQSRDASYGSYQRLYRDRDKILGDIIHAQPIYVKSPPHNFADVGYGAFKTAQASRAATLYAAANDGMLHAFDATDGTERWAYIPSMVLPNLWRLADRDYGNNHRFYLDGPLVTTDAYIGGAWKTVLIGAMGKGGRGYYALDITNPAAPLRLWEFTADNNNNVGYSYGAPFVTKLNDGTWVAVVTSGYNNVPEGSKYSGADGKGYLFVLNLADGTVLKKFPTGVGSTDTPSGLAKINVRMINFDVDNTAIGAYGGDLYGNMWRFDLNAADGTAPTKLAAFGPDKPIMAAPEISDINGKTAVFFGTGRYLGQTDLDNTSTQTIYGIKDDGSTTITDTTQLVQQTASTTGATRTLSKNAVDWSTQYGWYLDLPDSGERVTIDPQLYFGTLVIATTVPSATACQPGGYSWLYQMDYSTGGYVGSVSTVAAGVKHTSPIVGLTVTKLPTGTPVYYPITADGKAPSAETLRIPSGGGAGGTKRVLWREIVN